MQTRSALTALILQTVSARPLHGYRIAQQIKEASGGVLDFKEGTLYPALHALENKNWLESYESEESGRTRRYYKLTDKGRSVLQKERASWNQYAKAVTLVFQKA